MAAQFGYFLRWVLDSYIGAEGVEIFSHNALVEGTTSISKELDHTEISYLKIWSAIKTLLDVDGYTDYSPLWGIEQLPLHIDNEGILFWSKFGIKYMTHFLN